MTSNLDYDDTIRFLYTQTPQFQQIGAAAYKPGLDNVIALSALFSHPDRKLRCIHVAGTNGKGSVSHSIAAVLQAAGYKVGLFTSPHLIDFRERIRVNGQMIPRDAVVEFVDHFRSMAPDTLKPSFFELTTIMAFDWFARNEVDYAVIEVGLGGRLDSTNIITSILSIITNISFDHTAQLGHTLTAIAAEKAGIIKEDVPAVIGEASGEVAELFRQRAEELHAPIIFAEKLRAATSIRRESDFIEADTPFGKVKYGLTGLSQEKNLQTILAALCTLRELSVKFSDSDVAKGLRDVTRMTGLMGRWMTVCSDPLTICDTGHNVGGWEYISRQLEAYPGPIIMIIGFVNDKDISHIFPLIPSRAEIIYTQAGVARALPAELLSAEGAKHERPGIAAADVASALLIARNRAAALGANSGATQAAQACAPMIFVGGSTFIVADFLSLNNHD